MVKPLALLKIESQLFFIFSGLRSDWVLRLIWKRPMTKSLRFLSQQQKIREEIESQGQKIQQNKFCEGITFAITKRISHSNVKEWQPLHFERIENIEFMKTSHESKVAYALYLMAQLTHRNQWQNLSLNSLKHFRPRPPTRVKEHQK